MYNPVVHAVNELDGSCIYGVEPINNGIRITTERWLTDIVRAGEDRFSVKAVPAPAKRWNAILPDYAVGTVLSSVIATTAISSGVPCKGEPGCFSIMVVGKGEDGGYVLEYYGSDETETGAIAWMKPTT